MASTCAVTYANIVTPVTVERQQLKDEWTPVMGQHQDSSQTPHSCLSPQAKSSHVSESTASHYVALRPHQQGSACKQMQYTDCICMYIHMQHTHCPAC